MKRPAINIYNYSVCQHRPNESPVQTLDQYVHYENRRECNVTLSVSVPFAAYDVIHRIYLHEHFGQHSICLVFFSVKLVGKKYRRN